MATVTDTNTAVLSHLTGCIQLIHYQSINHSRYR
jgi:hypothetical protein